MFGLDFLFANALWALPLAGLPVLLHLLFRRKSPVIAFSTLRFIRSSLQHTAARKRVQRWLLLACRMLLLLLLIYAVAQPFQRAAGNWSGDEQTAAAIVIDTSYSMDYREGPSSLLNRADGIVQELLRGPLHDGNVAIFQASPPPPDQPERLQSATRVLSQWTPLKPQATLQPLAQRVSDAQDFLKHVTARHRWLIILSDLQRKEFPRSLPDFAEGRTILFDLRPTDPHAAGVTHISMHPEQPLPGIGSDVAVEVSGHSGDSRYVSLEVIKTDAQVLKSKTMGRAVFGADGGAEASFPMQLPAERWLLLKASLDQDEPLLWARTRQRLIETPPRQLVTVISDGPAADSAAAIFALALDPSQGAMPTWPLNVHRASELTGKEHVVVSPLTHWPDETRAARLMDFAKNGGTVILSLQPGIEQSWPKLSKRQQDALSEMLPSAPFALSDADSRAAAYRVGIAAPDDPLLAGLTDSQAHFESIAIRRFVPMAGDANTAATVLDMVSASASGTGGRPFGLLYRKKLGAGVVYTWATLPESLYTNLATHTRFLPLMVRMCLRPALQSQALNAEAGTALRLSGAQFNSYAKLELLGPDKQLYSVSPISDAIGRRFEFNGASEPGLYTWRNPQDASTVEMANVQYPASEAVLAYREPSEVVAQGPSPEARQRVVVARTFEEFAASMRQLNEPKQEWTMPMAIVLFLLCIEALLGSVSKWRRRGSAQSPSFVLPAPAASSAPSPA